MEKFFGLGSAIFGDYELDTSKRKEKIIVLPNNTLRFVDFPLYLDISHIINKPLNGDLDTLLNHLVCRLKKSIGELLSVDQNTVDSIFNKKYDKYWELAPRTEFYPMLEQLSHQSFIQSINILFDHNDISDNFSEKVVSEYYDGTFDGLVNYLSESNFTCLIISDVDLLYKLIATHKIDFNNTSILISRIGFNFTLENKYLELRHRSEIEKEFFTDFRTFDLFRFNKPEETN